MANTKYVFDEYGRKYNFEEEVKKYVETGTFGGSVLSNSVTYNGEIIPYEYEGKKPNDDYLVKLIICGLDFNTTLIASEVKELLDLGEFKLHIFLCETDLYITNGHCDCIHIYNSKLGYRNIYQNSTKQSYYMKCSSEIKDVREVTQEWYDNNPHEEGVTYIITDAPYTAESALYADEAGKATKADYASDDTSKGTIEERLTDAEEKMTMTSFASGNIGNVNAIYLCEVKFTNPDGADSIASVLLKPNEYRYPTYSSTVRIYSTGNQWINVRFKWTGSAIVLCGEAGSTITGYTITIRKLLSY